MPEGKLKLTDGNLSFDLRKSAYGKIVYDIYDGKPRVYVQIDYLYPPGEGNKSIRDIEWKLSLSDFNRGSTELPDLPDLKYTLEHLEIVEVDNPKDKSYYKLSLSKSTLEDCVVDNEEGKKKVLELLKEAPSVFLKGGEKGWVKELGDVLVKRGHKKDKRIHYVLSLGMHDRDLEVWVEPEGIEARKLIFYKTFVTPYEGKILDEKNPQKAKELISLFEKVIEGQVDLQDAVPKTLESLGLKFERASEEEEQVDLQDEAPKTAPRRRR